MECPLCYATGAHPFAEAHGRRYLRCAVCRLTFLDPAQRLGAGAERAHYDTHQNDPHDPGYRRFLARLADPLVERLPAGARGLDFGSGPGPTLSRMLREQGFAMEIFDPFFAPDESVLRRDYDFVTATEVVEHLFAPRAVLERIQGLLRPGGWLAVMTETLDDGRDFAAWRYARDPTHVCFFHPDTLRWIADHFGWAMERPHRNVVLFRKPAAAGRP